MDTLLKKKYQRIFFFESSYLLFFLLFISIKQKYIRDPFLPSSYKKIFRRNFGKFLRHKDILYLSKNKFDLEKKKKNCSSDPPSGEETPPSGGFPPPSGSFAPIKKNQKFLDEISKSFLLEENFFLSSFYIKKNNPFAPPRSIVNKNIFQGNGYAAFKNHIENISSKFYQLDFDFQWIKIPNFYKSATFLADEIVFFLEKRVGYNRIRNKLQNQIRTQKYIKGIRITYSGRLGGRTNKAERKKVNTLIYGQPSLHIFSSKLDFARNEAYTKFGMAGIKVWIAY